MTNKKIYKSSETQKRKLYVSMVGKWYGEISPSDLSYGDNMDDSSAGRFLNEHSQEFGLEISYNKRGIKLKGSVAENDDPKEILKYFLSN